MRECTFCHQIKEDSEYYVKKNGYVNCICKECCKKQAHELYLCHKKEVTENGHPKILHRKSIPISKVCTICDIEKDIEEFPYDITRDCYSNICKCCRYRKDKQKKPIKEGKFVEKKKLLSEGKQICTICGEVKPLEEMLAGRGKYTGICLICNKQRYRDKHGTEERLHKRECKRQQKREHSQLWNNELHKKRDLFSQGRRKCTKCGKILPLSDFAVKYIPPNTLQDYQAICRKCTKQIYVKPSERKRRLQNIIDFINTDFVCELCGEIKASYEMGIVNSKHCWCKKCQLQRRNKNKSKGKSKRQRNTPYKRLIYHLRKCLKDSLIGRKGHKTFIYLGCTGQEFKDWLESQFIDGMTWENRGIDGWHIDHYVPISYFDMSKEEDRFICWNYRNLRPLWGDENIEKGNTLPDDYLQHIEKIKKNLKFSTSKK